MTDDARCVEAEIGLCLLLSVVDGDVSNAEIGALSTRIGELLGDDFDPMHLPVLVTRELDQITTLGVDDYLTSIARRIPASRRGDALRAACVVAQADGLSPEEESVFKQAAAVLEVDVDAVLAQVRASV